MSDRNNHSLGPYGDGDEPSRDRASEFQQAVDRLEKAVHELVNSAKDQVSDRATAFIDETTSRLEREFGSRGSNASGSSPRERMEARRQERSRRASTRVTQRSRRLHRDPERQKIAGVCAGIAKYYGVEPWVIRCVAITGLLFLPSIVFPAYWILYFVMDKPPNGAPENNNRRARHDHTSPAPELGARLSPRQSLRTAQADLAAVELRLRRMETHITSGQYELQRELNKIDDGRHGGSTRT